MTKLETPVFAHNNLKNFQGPFKLHEFVPVCKKLVNSICAQEEDFSQYRICAGIHE